MIGVKRPLARLLAARGINGAVGAVRASSDLSILHALLARLSPPSPPSPSPPSPSSPSSLSSEAPQASSDDSTGKPRGINGAVGAERASSDLSVLRALLARLSPPSPPSPSLPPSPPSPSPSSLSSEAPQASSDDSTGKPRGINGAVGAVRASSDLSALLARLSPPSLPPSPPSPSLPPSPSPSSLSSEAPQASSDDSNGKPLSLAASYALRQRVVTEMYSPSHLECVAQRQEAILSELVRSVKLGYEDPAGSGVKKLPGGDKWGFELTDSLGRSTRRFDFGTQEEARAAYLSAQEAFLGPELTRMLREQLQAESDPAERVAGFIRESGSVIDLREQRILASLSEDGGGDAVLVDARAASSMSAASCTSLNAALVDRARGLWLAIEVPGAADAAALDPLQHTRLIAGERWLVEAAAARLRQVTSVAEQRRLLALLNRYQASANGRSGRLLPMVAEFARSSPGATRAMMNALALEVGFAGMARREVLDVAVFGPSWQSLEAAFQSSPLRPMLALRELFPDVEARKDAANVAAWRKRCELHSDVELSLLLLLQHQLALAAPERLQQAHRLVAAGALLRHAAPYGGELPREADAPLGELEAGGLRVWEAMKDAQMTQFGELAQLRTDLLSRAREADPGLPRRLPGDVPATGELAGRWWAALRPAFSLEHVKACTAITRQHWEELVRVGRVAAGRARSKLEENALNNLSVSPARLALVEARTCMRREAMEMLASSLAAERERALWWGLSHCMLDLTDRETQRALLGAARPEALARGFAFVERYRDLVPYEYRLDFVRALVGLVQPSAPMTGPRVERLPAELLRVQRIFGEHAADLTQLLSDFMALDSFTVAASHALVRHELEVAQCLANPASVPAPQPERDAEGLRPLPGEGELECVSRDFDDKSHAYDCASARRTRNALVYDAALVSAWGAGAGAGAGAAADPRMSSALLEARRRTRSSDAVPDSSPDARGPPERRRTPISSGFEWCGMDGRWYASLEDARRSWYTPDIVGGWATHERQTDALLATRRIFHASVKDAALMLELHRAVVPESEAEVVRTCVALVKELTPERRASVMLALRRYWAAQPPALYSTGRHNTSGDAMALRDLERRLWTAVGDSDILQPLIARIIQIAHTLTPEKITAVDLLLNHGTARAHYENSKLVSASGEIVIRAQHDAPPPPQEQQQQQQLQKADNIFSVASSRTNHVFEDELSRLGAEPGIALDPFTGDAVPREEWVDRTMYLGDLPTAVTEGHLKALFESVFGPVEQINLYRDRSLTATRTSDFLRMELNKLNSTQRERRLRDKSPGVGHAAAALHEASAERARDAEQDRGEAAAAVPARPSGANPSLVFESEAEVPGSKAQRELLVARLQRRKEALKMRLELYNKNALDAIHWNNQNWALAELIHASEVPMQRIRVERLALYHSTSDYSTSMRGRWLELALEPRALRTEKLSERLFELSEIALSDSDQDEYIVETVVGAHAEVTKAWHRYEDALVSAGCGPATYPTTVAEMNASGVPPASELNSAKARAVELKYEQFKSAAKYLHSLSMVLPRHFVVRAQHIEELCMHLAEAARRRALVQAFEGGVDLHKGHPDIKPKKGIVDRGFLMANTSEVTPLFVVANTSDVSPAPLPVDAEFASAFAAEDSESDPTTVVASPGEEHEEEQEQEQEQAKSPRELLLSLLARSGAAAAGTVGDAPGTRTADKMQPPARHGIHAEVDGVDEDELGADVTSDDSDELKVVFSEQAAAETKTIGGDSGISASSSASANITASTSTSNNKKGEPLGEDERQQAELLRLYSSLFAQYRGRSKDDAATADMAAQVRKLLARNRTSGKRATTNQLINAVTPATGVYAFVTFKYHDDAAKAMSPSMLAFGMTLSVPRRTAKQMMDGRGFDPARPDSIFSVGKRPDNFVCKVAPASTRTALFVEGFQEGSTAGEICTIVEELLRPSFPQLNLRSWYRGSQLTDGGILIKFRSHAESRVAADILQECSVVRGRKLIVGWTERPPRKLRNQKRSNIVAKQERFDPFLDVTPTNR
jgi:hypothetical protein